MMDIAKLPNPLQLDEKTLAEVLRAVEQGDKVAALQIVARASKQGLKVSKDVVDALWSLVHPHAWWIR